MFKEIKTDKEATEESQALQAYLALVEQESDLSSKIKTAQETLMAQVAEQYTALTEDDIKTLVVHDKWLATLADAVQGKARAESYATLIPEKSRDGGTEYSLYTYSLEWLARWLFGFGPEAQALAPKELRTRVKKLAKATLAHYGD